MATIHSAINQYNKMTDSAIRLAKWQEDLINNTGYRSAIESINTINKSLISDNMIETLKVLQARVQALNLAAEPIQVTLNIINKGVKFTDLAGLHGLREFSAQYQEIINKFNSSELKKLANTKFLPIGCFPKLETDDLEIMGSDDDITETDLSEDEKQEAFTFVATALDKISQKEIEFESFWIQWYDNLKIKYPLTARAIAKIADVIFTEAILCLVTIAVLSATVGTIPVKAEPSANAPVSITINVTNINVIDDSVNYYHQVSYKDDEGNEQTGYVSKRKYNQVVRDFYIIAEE